MSSENIKITVYIVSHNYGRYLQNAIESVLSQSMDSWELLLVNNGSTDSTKDIMSIYSGDPRVKIIETEHVSLPVVANLVLKNSRGEYIVRLDADDIFDENILLVLSNYLDRHQEVALVFPDYFLMDEAGGIMSQERRQPIYQSNHLLDVPAHGACTMIRKKILQELGGYREDLGVQDGFDLWSRIIKLYKCANVNLPLFYYRRHGHNITENHIRIISARREIKKDASRAKLDKHRPITAVIPCRKNYDIFPDLWRKEIGGKALLNRAIETCMKVDVLDNIVVTSDNPDVSALMSRYEDKRLVYVERSRESTMISSPMAYTLEHIVKKLGVDSCGLTILLYLQSPFTTAETLEEAIYTLISNDADSAMAVEEIGTPLYRRTPHGLMPINSYGNLKSDFDTVYREAMVAVASKNSNFRMGSLTGSKSAYFVIPKEETFFLQTKRDYEVANILMNQLEKNQ